MARWVDSALERIDPDLLLEDGSSVRSPPRPGEITQAHHDNAREAVINALTALDDGAWLGQLVTDSGDHSEPLRPSAEQVQLYRVPGSPGMLWAMAVGSLPTGSFISATVRCSLLSSSCAAKPALTMPR